MKRAAALVLALAVATACRRATRERPDAGPNATGLHPGVEYQVFGPLPIDYIPPHDQAWMYPQRRPDLYDGPSPTPVAGLDGTLRLEVSLAADSPPPRYRPTMYRLALLVAPDLDDAEFDDPWSGDKAGPEVIVGGQRYGTMFEMGDRDLLEIVALMNGVLRTLDRPRRLIVLADGRTVVGGRGDVLAHAIANGVLVPAPRW